MFKNNNLYSKPFPQVLLNHEKNVTGLYCCNNDFDFQLNKACK